MAVLLPCSRTAAVLISMLGLAASISKAATPVVGQLSVPVRAAHAGAPQSFVFSMSPEPLHDALQQYSRITGVSVLYDTGYVADKNSSSVHGAYSSREALERLVAGTGLQVRYASTRAFTLMPKPEPERNRAARSPLNPARQQYFGRLQSRILDVLCADPAIEAGRYRLVLRFGVGTDYKIGPLQVVASGRSELEPAIHAALSGLDVGAAPPAAFEQPATMLITPQSARRYGACPP
ncbi:TonB family protein [Pusillimonas sp. T7-7]|uniref:STN domain-containing protein n=1 Tax=Pusillimonas sp. (strain T7-7) TaxID=1007105 RepID=UPI0002084AEB|nr:STN domain-containing protein [Pusillimonas sp. T7-7]AEC18805.1 TonB family protein [Pusillimonas sp. T7-7]